MARELCCLIGIQPGEGFIKAAAKLKKLGQIQISPERLRGVVEAEGMAVLEARRKALLKPEWDASDCTAQAEGKTRLTVGVDGVMVPVITAAEKAKRRAGRRHVRRRGRSRRLAGQVRHRGSDERYKELKIGNFYDTSRQHGWSFASTGKADEFGRQLRVEAGKLRLGQAGEKFSVTDGAKWIRRQLRMRLPMLDEIILDFYHLSEHVSKAAAACWGLGSPQSKEWTGKLLHQAKHDGPLAVLHEIAAAKASLRAKTKRAALSELEQYVADRMEMTDYPKFIAAGYDIGSGPTEAKCKTVPARLKGSGMRWNLSNAQAMAALACLDQSGMMDHWWALQRKAVA
jgi:hypothetical protein